MLRETKYRNKEKNGNDKKLLYILTTFLVSFVIQVTVRV